MLRLPLTLTALALSVLAAPLAARADATTQFTFTPENYGPALTFTVSGAPYYVEPGESADYEVLATNGDPLDATFYNTTASSAQSVNGYGTYDFYLYDLMTSDAYMVDGPQLYTGSEATPTFLAGTYTLTGDPGLNGLFSNGTGTLQVVTSVTPEPASIVLLASGLLGLLWMERRRWVKSC